MSYINDALKKAQKEKDAKTAGPAGISVKPREKQLSFFRRKKYYFLIIIVIILFILSFKSWPDFVLFKKNSLADRSTSAKEGTMKRQTGNTKKAGAAPSEIREAGENDADRDSILFKEAVSLTRENRIDEAKLVYRKILSLNPGHLKALNDLGVLLLHEGEYETASGYFEKAVRLNPDNVDPYYNLACLNALSGDKEKGIAYLIKAVELDSRVKDWVKQDTDLESLRSLPEFDAVME